MAEKAVDTNKEVKTLKKELDSLIEFINSQVDIKNIGGDSFRSHFKK